jgi:hypothetical protein
LRKELVRLFNLLTVQLERSIDIRDRCTSDRRNHYRKLAKSLEKSLKALDDAINLIGE